MPADSCRHPRAKWKPLRNGRLVCGLCGKTMARTVHPGEERWEVVSVRVPASVAEMFRSELDRCKHVRGTRHDHLGLELLILNSAHTPPGEM